MQNQGYETKEIVDSCVIIFPFWACDMYNEYSKTLLKIQTTTCLRDKGENTATVSKCSWYPMIIPALQGRNKSD